MKKEAKKNLNEEIEIIKDKLNEFANDSMQALTYVSREIAMEDVHEGIREIKKTANRILKDSAKELYKDKVSKVNKNFNRGKSKYKTSGKTSKEIIELIKKQNIKVTLKDKVKYIAKNREVRTVKNKINKFIPKPKWLLDIKKPRWLSKIKLPKFKLPKIKLPKFKLPKIKLPKIKLPKIKFPKLPKIPKLGLIVDGVYSFIKVIQGFSKSVKDGLASLIGVAGMIAGGMLGGVAAGSIGGPVGMIVGGIVGILGSFVGEKVGDGLGKLLFKNDESFFEPSNLIKEFIPSMDILKQIGLSVTKPVSKVLSGGSKLLAKAPQVINANFLDSSINIALLMKEYLDGKEVNKSSNKTNYKDINNLKNIKLDLTKAKEEKMKEDRIRRKNVLGLENKIKETKEDIESLKRRILDLNNKLANKSTEVNLNKLTKKELELLANNLVNIIANNINLKLLNI